MLSNGVRSLPDPVDDHDILFPVASTASYRFLVPSDYNYSEKL